MTNQFKTEFEREAALARNREGAAMAGILRAVRNKQQRAEQMSFADARAQF
jgi:hypothetical protein